MGELAADAVDHDQGGDQGTVRRLLDFLKGEADAEARHEGDVDELQRQL